MDYEDPEREEGEILTPATGFINIDKNNNHYNALKELKTTQLKSILDLKLILSQQHSAYLSELDWQNRGYPGLTTSTLYWYNNYFPGFKEEIKYLIPNLNLIAPIGYALIVKEDNHAHFFIPAENFVPDIRHNFIAWLQLVSIIHSFDGDLHIEYGKLEQGQKLAQPYLNWKERAQEFREETYWNLASPDYNPNYYGPYQKRVKVIEDLDRDIELVNLGLPPFKAVAEFPSPKKQRLEQRVLVA